MAYSISHGGHSVFGLSPKEARRLALDLHGAGETDYKVFGPDSEELTIEDLHRIIEECSFTEEELRGPKHGPSILATVRDAIDSVVTAVVQPLQEQPKPGEEGEEGEPVEAGDGEEAKT